MKSGLYACEGISATDSAAALKALQPEGMAVAGKLAPTLKQAVTDGANDRTSGDRPEESPR